MDRGQKVANVLEADAIAFKRISLRIRRFEETGNQAELDDAQRQAERGFSTIRYAACELGMDLDMEHLELHALDETEGQERW